MRVNVHLAFGVIHVHKNLRRVADAGHGLVRVAAARQGKIGDGVQVKQEGAGDLKKVGEQFIGRPLYDQGGQVVENIKDPGPRASMS